jgi:hypothetical protein
MDVSSVGHPTANALHGLKKAEKQLAETAQNVASGSLDPKDAVSLSEAANAVKANAAVVKTDGEMTKSLLDIVS